MVKFPGSSKNPIQLLVPPGATASELLQHLGLKPGDFIVSKGSADTVFGKDEPLHPALSDGDCLYVTSAVDAGL